MRRFVFKVKVNCWDFVWKMCRTETNLREFVGNILQEVQQINKVIKKEGISSSAFI